MNAEKLLNKPDEWTKIPCDHVQALKEVLMYVRADGIQLVVDVEIGNPSILHVSLVPLKTMIENPEARVESLILEAPAILTAFFGDRTFVKGPNHPVNKLIRHYISIIETAVPYSSRMKHRFSVN